MTRKTIASVIMAGAITVVLLSGCAAVSPIVRKAAAEQSKIVACETIGASLTNYGRTLTSLSATMVKDPDGAVASVNSASVNFETAAAKVTNPTIKTAVVNLSNSVFAFNNAFKGSVYYTTPQSTTTVKVSLNELQSNIVALETACK